MESKYQAQQQSIYESRFQNRLAASLEWSGVMSEAE